MAVTSIDWTADIATSWVGGVGGGALGGTGTTVANKHMARLQKRHKPEQL